MNKTTQKVTTTYEGGRQAFKKVIRVNGKETVVKEGSFRKQEMKEVLYIDEAERTVVCVLHDGTVGVAKCMAEDEWKELKGIKIAYLRAKIASLTEELDQLVAE